MNNHITAFRYGRSTDKFDNHVFKCSNKNQPVAKKPCFEVSVLINCYVMNLTYKIWDLMQ